MESKGLCKLWFGDEAGFTENPPPTNAWAPAGTPHAHQMHTGTRKRLNAIGCCDFNLNPISVCFKEGKVGGVDFRAWGQALAAKCDPACPSHLWLDNGPIHKAKATLALLPVWKDKGLVVHFLPAYSPELNRIEIMWRIMKRMRPFELLEIAALRAALKSIIRHLRKRKS